MTMKTLLLLCVVSLPLAPWCQGQTLGDVLNSLDERRDVKAQADQVSVSLGNDLNGTSNPVDNRNWDDPVTGTGPWQAAGTTTVARFPSDAALAALGMEDHVALLNQAILEFEELLPSFVNIAPGELAGAAGSRLGEVRRFRVTDFPRFARATPENYHQLVPALGAAVRHLEVLLWPCTTESATADEDTVLLSTFEWDPNAGMNGECVEKHTENGASVASVTHQPTSLSLSASSTIGNVLEQVRNPEPIVGDTMGCDGAYSRRTLTTPPECDGMVEQETDYQFSYSFLRKVTSKAQAPEAADDQLDGSITLVSWIDHNPGSATISDDPPRLPPSARDHGGAFVVGTVSGSGDLLDDATPPTVNLTVEWRDITDTDFTDGDVEAFLRPAGFEDWWIDENAVPDEFEPYTYESLYVTQPFAPTTDPPPIYRLHRQTYLCLMTPTFEKGVDALDIYDTQDDLPGHPGGGQVLLRPEPQVLLAVDLGEGLYGSSQRGWLAVGPYLGIGTSQFPREGEPLLEIPSPIDQDGAISFAGSRSQYHLVWDTDRTARGSLPTWDAAWQNSHLEWDRQKVVDFWSGPALKQIVGRHFLADLVEEQSSGLWKQTIKIYRLKPGDVPASLAANEAINVSGLTGQLVRTLVFENPTAGSGGTQFPTTSEDLKVTDSGRAVYEASLSGSVWTLRITEPGGSERHKVTLDSSGTNLIETHWLDGMAGHARQIDWGIMGPFDWFAGLSRTVDLPGHGLVSYTYTRDSNASYADRWPTSVTVSDPIDGTSSATWLLSGVPQQTTRGLWSEAYSLPTTNKLEVTRKFNASVYGLDSVEWSSGPTTVVYTSVADGAIGAHQEVTTVTYGDPRTKGVSGDPQSATGGSLPWLPYQSTGAYGTQSETTYLLSSVDDSLSATVKSGPLGQWEEETVSVINKRGFPLQTTTSYKGAQVAGTTWSDPDLYTAPKKATDFQGGLETSWTYANEQLQVGTTTGPFGLKREVTARDALERVSGFKWNEKIGNRYFNENGNLGTRSTLAFGGNPAQGDIGTRERIATWDGSGEVTAASVTGGPSLNYANAKTATNRTRTYTNATTTVTNQQVTTNADGSLAGTAGNAALATTGESLTVDANFLKKTVKLTGLGDAYQTTWTDAWGRVRRVAVTGADGGGGSDLTEYLYSDPANPSSAPRRVEIRQASGRRLLEEFEPHAPAGSIRRSGIDVDQDGVLGSGDWYSEAVTSVVGGELLTVVSRTVDGGLEEAVRVQTNPASGEVVTTLNSDEEIITQTPNYAAKTVTTTWKRKDGTGSHVVYQTQTDSLNEFGRRDSGVLSGTGLPAVNLDLEFREDGSLSGTTVTIGSAIYNTSYDAAGRLTSAVDPLLGELLDAPQSFTNGGQTLALQGQTYTTTFDGAEHTSSVSGPDVFAQTRTNKIEGGGFVEVIDPGTGSSTKELSSAAGLKTGHDYLADGSAESSATYLPGGLVGTFTTGRGANVTATYSANGAKTLDSITWPSLSSAVFGLLPNVDESFQYDLAGRVKQVSDRSGTSERDYLRDRLTQTEWTAGNPAVSGDLEGYLVQRDYDDRGRLEKVTVKRDGTELHSYTVAYNGQSDELANVSVPGFFQATFWRNADRHIASITRGGVSQTWTRGVAGRIEDAGSTGVTGAPSFDYTPGAIPSDFFDAQGRRLACRTEGFTWSYLYGTAGQLSSATHPTLGTFTYQFDGIGRRTDFDSDPAVSNGSDALNQFGGMVHPTQKELLIAADAAARLWVNGTEVVPFNGGYTQLLNTPGAQGGWVDWSARAVLAGQGDPGAAPDAVAALSGNVWFPPTTETFSYDADGNRQDSAGWDYGWDSRNRLVRAKTKDYATAVEGWDLTFDYDAQGRRFKKDVIHKTTDALGAPVYTATKITFVWDGWDLLYERHENAAGFAILERSYVWGPDISGSRGGAGGAGGLMLMRETRGTTTSDYYPLYDGSGHVVALADSAGNLVAKYIWGPFGELIEASGPLANANPWRYATKYYDHETGLYYFGHRYYDPVTGQWLSREPLGEDESLNLYAYCHNDPINHVDVLGLLAVDTTREIIFERTGERNHRGEEMFRTLVPVYEGNERGNRYLPIGMRSRRGVEYFYRNRERLTKQIHSSANALILSGDIAATYLESSEEVTAAFSRMPGGLAAVQFANGRKLAGGAFILGEAAVYTGGAAVLRGSANAIAARRAAPTLLRAKTVNLTARGALAYALTPAGSYNLLEFGTTAVEVASGYDGPPIVPGWGDPVRVGVNAARREGPTLLNALDSAPGRPTNVGALSKTEFDPITGLPIDHAAAWARRAPTAAPTGSLPTVRKGVFLGNKGPSVAGGEHAVARGVERGVFANAEEASTSLKSLVTSLRRKSWPKGAILDTHANQVLVPVGNNGMAVFRVRPNGTAELRNVLNRR